VSEGQTHAQWLACCNFCKATCASKRASSTVLQATSIYPKTAVDMADTCRDDNFGPTVYSNTCQRFDFSLLFEDAIFSILPGCLFLLASFARMIVLYRKPLIARWTLLHSINSVQIHDYSYSWRSSLNFRVLGNHSWVLFIKTLLSCSWNSGS
jgi:hypothetical protein